MDTPVRIKLTLIFLGLLIFPAAIQSCSTNTSDEQFVFYFHGAVVTELGDNAINQSMPEWGPYEYSNILDSLRKRGFTVYSEIRLSQVDDAIYISKLVHQVDSLLDNGVNPDAILLLGASAGSYYVLTASSQIMNPNIRVAIMGGCWPDTYKDYSNITLYGDFISIIEESDPHKSCSAIFSERKTIKGFTEIELHTGLSHGFIYKGYAAWLDPLMEWFHSKK